ncbi:MAG: formylglycine-generating enzyme family protein [Deltaproteobacteria bacterium]|nr:formylglycine-generating enzyme family protein [Deltaproteobacteria bacterium]
MLRVFAALCLLMSMSCNEGSDPVELTEMVEVRSGLTYVFGDSEPCVGAGDEDPCAVPGGLVPTTWPEVQVTLSPFAIDQHEVTNLQYADCVKHKGCTPPPFDNAVSTQQQDYYGNPAFESHPVVNVTAEQAAEYCAWAGRRLPTEFEWERVAKGNPDEGTARLYPAEGVEQLSDCLSPDFPVSACRNDTQMDPVDRAPRDFVLEGGARIHHLFGNAAEWVDSLEAPSVTTCAGDLPASCTSCSECEGMSGTELTQCQQDCKTCSACEQDGGDEHCYYLCEDTALRTPFCTAYPEDVSVPLEALTATLADAPRGTMIRGGSVSVNAAQACQLRSAYRFNYAHSDDSKFNVGFRCARSL